MSNIYLMVTIGVMYTSLYLFLDYNIGVSIDKEINLWGNAAAICLFWFGYFIYGKQYCMTLSDIRVVPIYVFFVERIVLPIISTFFAIFCASILDVINLELVKVNAASIFFLLISLVLLGDYLYLLREVLMKESSIRSMVEDYEPKFMFLHRPPTKRSDLLPQEIMLIGVFLFLYVKTSIYFGLVTQ